MVMQDEWQRSDAEFESIHSNAIVGRSAWGFLGTMPLSRDDVALSQFGECAAEQACPSQKNRCACSVLRVRYVSPNEASQLPKDQQLGRDVVVWA